jgi:hypothetical protein
MASAGASSDTPAAALPPSAACSCCLTATGLSCSPPHLRCRLPLSICADASLLRGAGCWASLRNDWMCLCTARLPENIAWFEARFADMLPPGLPCGKLVQRPRTKATGIGKHCLVRGEGHGGMVLHGGANESGTCAAKFSAATKKVRLLLQVSGSRCWRSWLILLARCCSFKRCAPLLGGN